MSLRSWIYTHFFAPALMGPGVFLVVEYLDPETGKVIKTDRGHIYERKYGTSISIRDVATGKDVLNISYEPA